MDGKELKQRIEVVVEELAGLRKQKSELDAKLPLFRIRWSIQGTTMVRAEDEDGANDQFDTMEVEELVPDLISIDLYDVELWSEPKRA